MCKSGISNALILLCKKSRQVNNMYWIGLIMEKRHVGLIFDKLGLMLGRVK